MDKSILSKYSDAKARIKHLRRKIKELELKIDRLEHTEYGIVGDTVSRGKRGKKPLGTVKVSGFDISGHRDAICNLEIRKTILKSQEEELLCLTNEVEEFIQSIDDIELQNILTLYYIEDLIWVQVAFRMNELYENKHYTTDSCRVKHDRFLKKI